MKKVTIEDIAQKSGFSITAVSFALNNKPGVSHETAKKILQVAHDLNYHIPQVDQAIVKNTTIQVVKVVKHGDILNNELNPFIMSYIDGIELECSEQKSHMQLISYHRKPIKEIEEELEEHDADGFIIIATELNRDDVFEFSSIQKPLCFIDANYDFMPFSFVDIDNTNSVGIILKYLKDQGHEHIGLATSTLFSPNFDDREKAFRNAIHHYNLVHHPSHCIHVPSSIGDNLEHTKMQLSNIVHLPSAFFCVNDSVAYNTIQAMQSLGLNVPNDISIVGFDDLALSKICNPPLTTVSISNTQIGMRATQLLTQRIRLGYHAMSERISISGRLVERESVKGVNNE